MIDSIKRIYQVKMAYSVNAFIYYFKRLFLIGKLMPDSMYGEVKAKNILAVFVNIFLELLSFGRKVAYLLLMIVLPIAMVVENPIIEEHRYGYIVHIMFFLSCFIGILQDSQIFTVTQNKYICIKYLHMNPKNYVRASLIIKYVPFYLYWLIILPITAVLFGATIFQGILLWIVMLCFRMMGEALQLWLYDKKEFVLSRKNYITFPIILIGLTAAYLPLITESYWGVMEILFHPISMIVIIGIAFLSIYYILFGYKKYESTFVRSIDTKYLISNAMKQSKTSVFKAVEMKEQDLTRSKLNRARLQNLKGYSYLNALFFDRHRRQLLKAVYYRLLFLAGVFAVGVVFYFINPEMATALSTQLVKMLPKMVLLMYGITIADKACKAMFYNCDISLLRYGFYRKPQAILRNFRIRLMRISLYNLITGVAVCLVVIGFCILCGTNWFTYDMLMLFGAVLLLSIFFTVHHLFLYYVFQPYSTGLDVKNPFFKVLNGIIYFVSYMCFQIDVAGTAFTVGVLIFTVLYIIVALCIVYRYAPKHFRVK